MQFGWPPRKTRSENSHVIDRKTAVRTCGPLGDTGSTSLLLHYCPYSLPAPPFFTRPIAALSSLQRSFEGALGASAMKQ